MTDLSAVATADLVTEQARDLWLVSAGAAA
mgnify:CR=1 FL=1